MTPRTLFFGVKTVFELLRGWGLEGALGGGLDPPLVVAPPALLLVGLSLRYHRPPLLLLQIEPCLRVSFQQQKAYRSMIT